MSSIVINDTKGLATHDNDLSTDVGSTSLADNVVFDRDGRPGRRRGFKDYSSNLPDFAPTQLIASASQDQAYLHLDNGIWYHDGTRWLRKRCNTGASLLVPAACVASGNYLFVVTNSHVIHQYDLSTGTRVTLAGRFNVTGSTDATGDAARFHFPEGVCTDGTNLYVCDNFTHIIRKVVIATGVVTTLAGTAGASGSTDNTGAAARFSNPYGICYTGGNLYVCDYSNHTIRKIVASSGVVTTLAGTAGASGSTDNTGAAARFNTPRGICTDGTNLYVCDYGNHTIRKIVISSGVVTTLAGTAGASGSTDATGSAARFNNVDDVSISTDLASIYVNEIGNDVIRKVVIATGVVTTPYGTAGSAGYTDGIGAAARFTNPNGSTVRSEGGNDVIYVCDGSNNAIRKIYTQTGYVSTIDGATSGEAQASSGLPFAAAIIVGPSE